MNNIWTLLPKVMSEISPIQKKGANELKYKFIKFDDIISELRALFATHGITPCAQVLEKEEGHGQTKSGTPSIRVVLKVRYLYYAPDGSYVDDIVYGEAIDYSDKAYSKALTQAYKKSLSQKFLISDGGEEPDDKSPEIPRNNEAKKPAEDKSKLIHAEKEKHGWTNADLKYVMKNAYGIEKTNELSDPQINSIIDRMKAYPAPTKELLVEIVETILS